MITLPWLTQNPFSPLAHVGKEPVTISAPVTDRATRVPRHADPETVIMRADPAALPAIENSRTILDMERPPRSDTPYFNETTQFPHKSQARPNPLPTPIRPTPGPKRTNEGPNQVHYIDPKEDGLNKERRSSPHVDPSPQGSRKTNDHPWSMQGYDCDDPRGLQDVTYSRGEACIEKMKVRHIRNATIHVLQKRVREEDRGVLFGSHDTTGPILWQFQPYDHV